MEDIRIPLITVNGNALPTPSTYDTNVATFVNGQRNATGVMIGETLREGVLRVDLTWRYLRPAQWRDILSLFTGVRTQITDDDGRYRDVNLGGNFINDIILYDPEIGEWDLRKMYVSDRQSSMHMVDSEGRPTGFLECTLNLIEV